MIFPCVTESENILPSSRSQERNLKSTGRKCVLSMIWPPFTVVFIITLKRKITWSQFWNKIWIFLFLFFSNMKPKRNDYFLCPIPWTEIDIFKRSETFFPFLKTLNFVWKPWRKSWHWNIRWNTKSNSIECDSSHLYLKRRWRKSEFLESNENEENLCVIFKEKFVLVQNFLKIASCN